MGDSSRLLLLVSIVSLFYRHETQPMSIWKSPVFYFGLLLVLLVGGALAAPFIVDWNSYRPNLEAYGRKISGRDVVELSGAGGDGIPEVLGKLAEAVGRARPELGTKSWTPA